VVVNLQLQSIFLYLCLQESGSIRVFDSGLAFGSPLNLGNLKIFCWDGCFVMFYYTQIVF
jgi:hypothetical protein